MQKEERIRVDSDKDMIIEFGHEAAQDFRFGFCEGKERLRIAAWGIYEARLTTWFWRCWSLLVLGFKVQLQTGQRKDHFAIVIVFLRFGCAAAARRACALNRIGGYLTFAL